MNKIEHIDPNKLKPYDRNARVHSDQQIEKIAASIHEFGFVKPVIIDEANMILAGHGATRAAQLLAMETVPCIRKADLSEEQKRAYILIDNRLGELSTWDKELVALEMSELAAADFDLEPFSMDALLPAPSGPNNVVGGDRHLLLIECDGEQSLQALFDEMMKRGLSCKLMT